MVLLNLKDGVWLSLNRPPVGQIPLATNGCRDYAGWRKYTSVVYWQVVRYLETYNNKCSPRLFAIVFECRCVLVLLYSHTNPFASHSFRRHNSQLLQASITGESTHFHDIRAAGCLILRRVRVLYIRKGITDRESPLSIFCTPISPHPNPMGRY
jgi:hypothetical protein